MTLAASAAISPCLWFDHELEEAAEFYTKIFPNSSIGHMARYTEAGPGRARHVMAGEFTLDGLTFRGINGGPEHAGFTETISFSVTCNDQAEVDHYWDVADRRRRRGVGLRLAQGPVRAVVADRPASASTS